MLIILRKNIILVINYTIFKANIILYMEPIIIYSITVGVIYLTIISLFHKGWNRLPVYQKKQKSGHTSVSIIIACRNEEKNIPVLLKCLNEQDYPGKNFEVFIIDDHSDDNTVSIVSSIKNLHYALKTYALPTGIQGKKQAIRYGIQKTNHNLVITLDADIFIGHEWLSTIVSFYNEYNPGMIICPVVLHKEKNIFEKIQSLEWLSLIGSGAGSAGIHHPINCNGANLVFTKDNYYRAIPDKKTPSGDDIMLMANLKKMKTKNILFLKSINATACTKPCTSLKSLLNQRKRWASKSKYYKDADIIITAMIIFLLNLSLMVLIAGSVFIHQWIVPFTMLFLIKMIADLPFLISLSSFFNKRNLLWYFPITALLYIIYVPYTAIAGSITSFTWKNRKYYP
jgi:glycosyltransferase involved in cell wall biosynthesis